jgi:hypothetical protein
VDSCYRNRLRLLAHQSMFDDHVSFLLVRQTTGEPQAVCTQLQFTEGREGECIIDPTFSLPYEQAQELMNALWNIGLRPVQGKQSEGQVAAVERHLADMRAIAFSRLEIKQP